MSKKEHDEAQYNIGGAIAGPGVAVPAAIAPVVGPHDAPAQVDAPQCNSGAGGSPSFPTPPAPELENPVELENLFFPEPNQQLTPAHVHNNNSQAGVPAQGTVNASTALVQPSPPFAFARRTDARSQGHTQGHATVTRTGPQPPRILFDCYDHDRVILTRQQLTADAYYEYLAQQSALPQTRDEDIST